MKISGTASLPALRERAYTLLLDPVVLARCMPGCESLDLIGEKEYAMRMKLILASITGLFEGKVRVAEENPVESFRLIVEGTGKIGFMKGDGLITLTPAEASTAVRYEGEVNIGGTIAAVGQRLIDTTAKMLIKRFFNKLAAEAGPAATIGSGIL